MSQIITMTEGEFAGWSTYDHMETFDSIAGPYYSKRDPDGSMRTAFRAEQRHMNAFDRMHGGCLMTFADIALFRIAKQEVEGAGGVTVQMDSQFIDGPVVGDLVEATGEVVRAGKNLVFVRGQITVGDRNMMTFSGIIRKFSPRAA